MFENVGFKNPTYIYCPKGRLKSVFRRPFVLSVWIVVAWALPTKMAGKRGRLKFGCGSWAKPTLRVWCDSRVDTRYAVDGLIPPS